MSDPNQDPIALYRSNLLELLAETFERVQGYFLDRDTSLFETLAGIDAPRASLRYSPYCSNLAAQVNHTRFYLDVSIRAIRDDDQTKADWDASWNVGAVAAAEWTDLVEGLRSSYEDQKTIITTHGNWDDEAIGGTMGIVAHSAYHLGEIRQALAIIPVVSAPSSEA